MPTQTKTAPTSRGRSGGSIREAREASGRPGTGAGSVARCSTRTAAETASVPAPRTSAAAGWTCAASREASGAPTAIPAASRADSRAYAVRNCGDPRRIAAHRARTSDPTGTRDAPANAAAARDTATGHPRSTAATRTAVAGTKHSSCSGTTLRWPRPSTSRAIPGPATAPATVNDAVTAVASAKPAPLPVTSRAMPREPMASMLRPKAPVTTKARLPGWRRMERRFLIPRRTRPR
ncbi:hypothetical protein GCM10023081_18870 [Arthrobacter ginkgonis]|uniref:Uncharacterized protein n=1 Tax=Arthrobacter ginkgonis TaxID=1630594 RepID=A0ABP7C9S1_9MICC